MNFLQIKERLQKLPRRFIIYIAAAAVCTATLIFIGKPEKKEEYIPPPTEELFEEADYAEELSRKLESIISGIRGVGEVSVMVTVDGTVRRLYASDVSESDMKSETKTVIVGSKEALEEGTRYPEIKGVLVVCRGGGSPSVKEKVVNAVSTVLDIPTGKVFVTDSK